MSEKDEEALFWAEMAGVRPLQREPKVRLQNARQPSAEQTSVRRQAALTEATPDDNPLGTTHIDWVAPTDVLTYRVDGIAHGVFRRLKQGGYTMDARLDLHRYTVEQARIAVFKFIQDCRRYDVRAAIILHGKGERGDQKAVVKSHVNHWLRTIPEVLAFHSAQPNQGGAGALYVLIKKSEASKQQNRERYRRGD